MNVILLVATSVNGMIAKEGLQNSFDWTSKEDKQFFVEKTKEIGVVIMGRKTFETIGKPLKNRRLIVMTRNKNRENIALENESVEFTDEDPKNLLNRLEKEGVESVVIAGGSEIYSLFLENRLAHELFATIEPVLFGCGISFLNKDLLCQLKLKDCSKLNDSTVLLHYKFS